MIGSILARLAVAIAPPALLAGASWPVVTERPVAAGVLLLGYLALLRFAGELAKRWQTRLVDLVDSATRRRVTRFHRHYREFVLSGLRYIDLKGLATIGFYTPELDEVYIDVSLTFRAPHAVPSGVVGDTADAGDRHSIQDFLGGPDPVVLALVGPPGSGKTTLLRHTARRTYQRRRARRNVPMLLYMRDHVATISATPGIALPQLVAGMMGPSRKEPDGWFEQRLHDGDCIVLVDGLDEVGRQEDRRDVVDWLDQQIQRYPRNDYVVTSRPQGYLATPVEGAAVLQVCGFTDDQASRFVHGWYLAVEQRSAENSDIGARDRARSAAADLLDRLNDAPGLFDLTTNPLLLTMVANIHRYRGGLPGTRAHLYGEICQVLLWRRQEAKRLPVDLGGDGKEVILRGLAFTMMKRRMRDLPREAVLAEIRPVLRRMNREMSEATFVADASRNGLLVERENGVFSFAHHTFQEYLAAAHVRDIGAVAVLANAIDDIWWRETTLLYSAGNDLDPVVSACLASGSVTALSLAFDCVQIAGGQLNPVLRDQLDDLLGSAFTPSSPLDRRRLIASVLVARHLRNLIRTGAGTRICARPIPDGIYWLYRRETGCPAPDRAPEDAGGSENQPMNEPITGTRGRDAVGFVAWINALTGNDPQYRLPRRGEIENPTIPRALAAMSAWCLSENGEPDPQLWADPEVSHPHLVDSATLTDQLRLDLDVAGPTLVRLLLLRAIVTTRFLTRVLDRRLDRAVDVMLDHIFDLTRTIDHISVIAPHFEIRGVRDRVAELAIVLKHKRDTAAVVVGELIDELTCAFNRADHTAVSTVLAGVSVDGLSDALPEDLSVNEALPRIMGTAMSRTFARVLRHAPRPDAWHLQFTHLLVEQVGLGQAAHVVPLETLADKIERTCDAFTASLDSTHPAQPWVRHVTRSLTEIAVPIALRQEPLTDVAATALRLAALCLAAEADAATVGQLGSAFREIGAGITLLQQRRTGQSTPTETIILAAG
jgi:NACHT domain-containing protein